MRYMITSNRTNAGHLLKSKNFKGLDKSGDLEVQDNLGAF